ncbi:Serine/threonine protein kinase [Handroanthus impetiginosus]|uniref:Serine/threonine protein kinase n=1 Tax=Handroanthus impetiginosus TaxID=429701 RepID=A0A2G9GZA7_9LAMI|nr:Serine/threonine protein kinase [Handroanthus impetiginosus]
MRISVASIIVVLVSLSTQSFAFEVNEFYPEERDALMQLRDVVSSTSNLHANWTGPPCNKKNQSRWAGIACSDWHVTHLVLEGINLTGSLPSRFLQNLTLLSKLSFRNNSLHGPLPNLTNLLRLEFVFLSRNQFLGSIPSGYIDLTKLTKLELQENDLSGQIPPFDQQSLIAFNVSNNKLEGPIPDTPVLQRFPKSSYANNSALCGGIPGLIPCPIAGPPPAPGMSPASPPIPSRGKNGSVLKSWSIALIAAAAVLVPLSVFLIVVCYNRRVCGKRIKEDRELQGEVYRDRKGKQSQWSESTNDPEGTLQLEFLDKPFFDLDDLLRAAAEVIGRGKLGTTYKTMLECGSVVAVKRLKETNALSRKEFVQQMHLLGNAKHENLAEIISFYNSKEEKLIIYEYVPDGSLFSLLHENTGIGRRPLDWNTRVKIIEDIAKGMDLLHHRLASQAVPHGNLKSSNVVIQRLNVGNSIRAKLTDYGLLPLVPVDKLSVGRTPEFREGKKLTSKADVYCFGIIVLEIVTGKDLTSPLLSSPSSLGSNKGGRGYTRDLSVWVRAALNNDWSPDILDMEIVGEKEGYDQMLRLTEIGLECTHELPERRPKMTQVLSRVQDAIITQTN